MNFIAVFLILCVCLTVVIYFKIKFLLNLSIFPYLSCNICFSHAIVAQDVYEQHKELILLGERVVLATLGFDLNVHHPYKPLVEAIKKFKVAQNALAQVAWNFVNDGYEDYTNFC